MNIENVMKVKITDIIDDYHQSHYWYWGECAIIKCMGYKAIISACGDVWANLYNNNKWADHMCDDKWNASHLIETVRKDDNFYERMSSIKDDDHLLELEEKGYLRFEERNWWECIIIDPQAIKHELDWILDSTNLLDAIDEVKNKMLNVIHNLEPEDE